MPELGASPLPITGKFAWQSIKRIPADGNCFYGAVADQLQRLSITTRQGEHYSHQSLRRIALDYINIDEAFRDDIAERLQAGDVLKGDLERTATNIEQYIEHHSKDYAWADLGMIGALCKALNISISCYNTANQVTQLNGWIDGRNISVLYSGNHYNSIIIDVKEDSPPCAVTAASLAMPLKQEDSKAPLSKESRSKPQPAIKTGALKYEEVMSSSDYRAQTMTSYIMFSDPQKIIELLDKYGIRNADGSEMRTKSGLTFLHTAASHGKSAVVLKLLAMGADPNAKTGIGQIAIGEIIEHCFDDAIMAALEKTNLKNDDGSDVRQFCQLGDTLLWLAARNRCADTVICKMIDMGADPFSRTLLDSSPIYEIIRFYREATILYALTKMNINNPQGSDLADHKINQDTMLHCAARYIKPGIVLRLLKMGLDPNAKNEFELLPMHYIIEYWNEETALSALEAMTSGHGKTLSIANASALLHPAATANKIRLFVTLLAMGACPNAPHAPYQRACYAMGRIFETLGRIDEASLQYKNGIEQEKDEQLLHKYQFRTLMIEYAKSGKNDKIKAFLDYLYHRAKDVLNIEFNAFIKELILPNANEYVLVANFYDAKQLRKESINYYKAAIECSEGNETAEKTLRTIGFFRMKRTQKQAQKNAIDQDTIRLFMNMIEFNGPNVLSTIEMWGISNPDGSEITDGRGRTLLQMAAISQRSEIVLKLLEMGADPNHRDSNNDVAIEAIIRYCSKEAILAALKTTNCKNQYGSDLRYGIKVHDLGDILLSLATTSKCSDEAVLKLIEMGANPNAKQGDKARSIMFEIIEHCSQMVIINVLEQAISKDDCGENSKRDKNAFLEHAISCRKPDVAVTLLAMGARSPKIEGKFIAQVFDHPDAINIFNKILEVEPDNIEALKGISYVYVDQKNHDLALPHVIKAAILDPKNAAHYANIALCLNKLAKFNEAIESAKSSISIDEEISYAHYQLGCSLHEKLDFSGAIAAYQKSLDIHPLYYPAWHQLGKCYTGQKEYEKAIDAYQQAIKHNSPDTYSLYTDIGTCYYKYGKDAKGIEAFKKALAHNNGKFDSLNHYYRMGACYHHIKNYSDALEYYKKALALDPNHAPSIKYLTSALQSLKRYDAEHLALVQDILSKHQTNEDAFVYCAEYYYQQKDYNRSLEYLGKLIAQNEKDIFALNQTGHILYLTEKYQEALEYFNQAVSIEPQNPKIHANLANIYQKLNLYDEALAEYNRSLELIQEEKNPLRFVVSCFKGNLLRLMGIDEEALMVLNNADELSLSQNLGNFNELHRDTIAEALSNRLELIEKMQTSASVFCR